ncbi:MAG: alpha/beta fold hydrolase [Verrucomicrobia bacterium]|nr:alpha/beta fold hydrolase [Verrucomicrobiota bacterium]
MNRQRVKLNGMESNYCLEGEPGRPVVLLCHPLGVNLEVWAYQVPILKRHFQVLRYDLRGHGGSTAGELPYGLETLAADAVALLDRLSLDRVAFIGLSIGGMIGQIFALQYPARLSALVLCSTGSRTGPQAKANIEQRIQRVRSDGMESQVPLVLQNWFTDGFRQTAPATMGWIADLIRSTQPDGFIGCCRAIQELDALDRLSQIRVPTLLIAGDQDKNFPPSVSEEIKGRIAGSELRVLASAAHLGSVEQVHAFNESINGFLQRVLSAEC